MKQYSILFILFLPQYLLGQVPDWSTEIASIIYSHCSTCHHEGGIAPFPLMSYEDVVMNAFSIQADINASIMPPWPPDPSYNHFRDEKVLSESEITVINDWVNGGMPAGNLVLAPPAPVFNGGTLLSEIDDTINVPAYTVQEMEADEYRSFVIHSNYTETKYLNQVEFIPGEGSIVHHAFLMQDTSDLSYEKDIKTPEPGFPGGGVGGFSKYAVLLCGWIPGSDVIRLPSNMGFEVPAGADFIVAVHYAPGSYGKTDSMKINLKFSDAPVVRSVGNQRLLYWTEPSLINGPFFIPANQVVKFYEQTQPFVQDLSLIAVQPHSHLIGKSWKVYMVTAPGDTTNLLYIPDWKFEWQLNYFFTKVIKIPVGAQIFGEAVFDNTINNPNNPSNPPIDVYSGESTLDEMMGCRFSILDYQPGDEDIILDSSFYYFTSDENLHAETSLQVQILPNPVSTQLHFVTWLPEHEIQWTLTDQSGRIVRRSEEKNIPAGVYANEIDVRAFSAGIYYLTIRSGSRSVMQKVVVAVE